MPLCVEPSGPAMPAAVDGKDDRNFLQAHVVEKIVEGPLQKCRIDGGDDLHFAAIGNASAESDGVPFGDSHVEASIGKFFHEIIEHGSCRHGGCDSDQARIIFRHFKDVRAENFWESGFVEGVGRNLPVPISKGLAPW